MILRNRPPAISNPNGIFVPTNKIGKIINGYLGLWLCIANIVLDCIEAHGEKSYLQYNYIFDYNQTLIATFERLKTKEINVIVNRLFFGCFIY